MSANLALVDTNVLVYALYAESEHHAACRALLDRAQAGELSLCFALQTLAEFYAVVTDSRRVTVPRSPAEALAAVEAMACGRFTLSTVSISNDSTKSRFSSLDLTGSPHAAAPFHRRRGDA